MASKVQLCNIALSRLGGSTITSLTDDTREAILCNTLFDDLARQTMYRGSWTTTIKRATLAQTTTTPTFEYTYEYQLPVDPKCLRVLNVNYEVPGDVDYQIEGDKLLTDEGSIKIRYIGELTDTEDYGVALSEAVQTILMAYLAIPIAGDKTLAAQLEERYEQLVLDSLALDGKQGQKQHISVTDLKSVR